MISEIYYLSWAIRTLHPTKRVIKRRERDVSMEISGVCVCAINSLHRGPHFRRRAWAGAHCLITKHTQNSCYISASTSHIVYYANVSFRHKSLKPHVSHHAHTHSHTHAHSRTRSIQSAHPPGSSHCKFTIITEGRACVAHVSRNN